MDAEIKTFSWTLMSAILEEWFMVKGNLQLSQAIFSAFGIEWGQA